LRNRRFIKRIVSLVGSLALAGGFLIGLVSVAGPASATPVPPSTSSCTYNGNASIVTGVAPGSAIAVVCSGLPASTSVAIAEASPLGGVIDPASAASNEADTGAVVIATTSATGTLSASFTVPATFTASDANAACPPTQAQVNAGLTDCAVAVASVATQTPLDTALVAYTGQATPAAPTLSLSPTSGIAGDVFNATDASGATSFWWGAATTGAPSTTPAVPGFTAQVGTATATNTLAASKDVYCFTGHTSAACAAATTNVNMPPKLSGTITMPAGVAAGAATVKADEPNTTPDAGNGTLAAIIPGTANVEGTSTVTQLGTPAITASPASGGPGTAVSISGTNFDPQGGAVTVAFSTASTGHTADSTTATVGPSGSFTASLKVSANDATGANPINATQTAKSGATLTAQAAFTVLTTTANCSTPGGAPGCSIQQILSQTVNGDPSGLNLIENNGVVPTVTMTPITLNGFFQTATGALVPFDLNDTRGTLVGWSLTAQFNSDTFGCTPASGTGSCPGAHAIDNTIPATDFVAVNPNVVCASVSPPSCVPTEVTEPVANQVVNGPSGSADSLGSAAAGGGGGSFAVSSNVTLSVPPYIAAGVYTDTLNINVQ
jgi:hypothetical protein